MGPQSPDDCGGVDLYVGGVEHAVLHLLYARFWHKVLYDLGHISSFEPFRRLFNQGYIQAYAYTDARGRYVPAEEVVEQDGQFLHGDAPVRREYGKMGKSLRNVVTPDDMCAAYGADTFRVYEMSMGPLDVSRPWETRAVVGSHRFLQRVWRLVVDENTGESRVSDAPLDDETARLLHRTIDGVRADMEGLRFNTAIAKLIELTNRATAVSGERDPACAGRAAGPDDRARSPRTWPRSCGSAWATGPRWRTSRSRSPTRPAGGGVGDLPGAGQREGPRPDRGFCRCGRGRRACRRAGRGSVGIGRSRAAEGDRRARPHGERRRLSGRTAGRMGRPHGRLIPLADRCGPIVHSAVMRGMEMWESGLQSRR